MSSVLEDIKNQFGDFSNKRGPAAVFPAGVTAVNDDDTVKVLLSDNVEIDDVRLRSVIKAGNKIVLVPKVGSIILIARIENSEEFFCVAVEEISDVVYKIGEVVFSIDEAGFVVKKDNDDLKEALIKIIDAVQKIIVLQGTNPDRAKLIEAKASIQNIFK